MLIVFLGTLIFIIAVAWIFFSHPAESPKSSEHTIHDIDGSDGDYGQDYLDDDED